MPRGPGQPDVSTSNRPGPRIDRTRTQTQPDPTAAATRRLTARHITWWRVRDSNPRPRRCERRALPTELTPRPPAIVRSGRAGDKRLAVGLGSGRRRAEGAQERREEIDRQRDEGGRVPLRGALPHGLQIP